MYKDLRYINAGTNEIYRYGKKAVERATACLEPNSAGYISIPADGGKYWTIGTSNGKYGEFCNLYGTNFSVNRAGYVWAKADTEKGDKLIEAITRMIEQMHEMNAARLAALEDEDDMDEI